MSVKFLSSPKWDYTEHAIHYSSRPNYSPNAIDKLIDLVSLEITPNVKIADIGAGTGNLSVMLNERGVRPILAVEPNFAMLKIGIERTREMDVYWKMSTGESTCLPDSSCDWMLFGSSFNTTDRSRCLAEVNRVLKPGGYFTCMWNNRELETDPVQQQAEDIIRKYYPEYSHGTRREDQTPILDESGFFETVQYLEDTITVRRTIEQYIDAWRSVRNQFWDVNSEEGKAVFAKIEADLRDVLGNEDLEIQYTTRIWTAKLKS
jgi:ubiquinone/menaquinone biosynthesis C-methylase UbiE